MMSTIRRHDGQPPATLPDSVEGLPPGMPSDGPAAAVYRYLSRQPMGHSVPLRTVGKLCGFKIADRLSDVMRWCPTVFKTSTAPAGHLLISLASRRAI